jgi:hypothetical protein
MRRAMKTLRNRQISLGRKPSRIKAR